MSLILKGIDLPKEQSLLVFIANNGAVVCSGEDGVTTTEAIQIPKGVRLIDANEVKNDMMDAMCFTGYQARAMDVIEFASTILESEER